MAYASWSVVFGEQPSASKWNILGTNDADFNTKLTRAGMVVQTVMTAFTAAGTTTTTLPVDDTIPQITEGFEVMTQAITPISATNKLIIEVVGFGSHSVAATAISFALFQDATSNALAAAATVATTSTGPAQVPLGHIMTSGTTSSTTFRVRAGGNQAGTFTFNGNSSARLFGAITKSYIKITEIVV